jgi:ElaB/YqjD/DUF883 family membrane-anchored ribosome-binding protein
MATSNNPQIQRLINEVERLDTTDIEAKLQLIAQKVAEEQQKIKAKADSLVHDESLIDPSDAFACEGCQ